MIRKTILSLALVSGVIASCGGTAGGVSASEKAGIGCQSGRQSDPSEAGLDQIELCVRSGRKTHKFTVEVARTSPQQARGLMFRTSLADDKGMLFPFSEERVASFWMKNTVIPLDILFIRSDGRIENIAANTTPYSTDPVLSTAPVTAVLELRGGLSAELGIKPGDTVRWLAR